MQRAPSSSSVPGGASGGDHAHVINLVSDADDDADDDDSDDGDDDLLAAVIQMSMAGSEGDDDVGGGAGNQSAAPAAATASAPVPAPAAPARASPSGGADAHFVPHIPLVLRRQPSARTSTLEEVGLGGFRDALVRDGLASNLQNIGDFSDEQLTAIGMSSLQRKVVHVVAREMSPAPPPVVWEAAFERPLMPPLPANGATRPADHARGTRREQDEPAVRLIKRAADSNPEGCAFDSDDCDGTATLRLTCCDSDACCASCWRRYMVRALDCSQLLFHEYIADAISIRVREFLQMLPALFFFFSPRRCCC